VIAQHHVPYVATASAAFPDDMRAKIEKALSYEGFRMILLLTPCVTWGYDSRYSVKLARLAVETGYFPLYEVEYGTRYCVTYEPPMLPLEEFTRLQKRFRGAPLDLVRWEIEQKWEDLRFKMKRVTSDE
jgi:pyruvate/2-oxoacid:ferredoxin oxidoreductase beta subunit